MKASCVNQAESYQFSNKKKDLKGFLRKFFFGGGGVIAILLIFKGKNWEFQKIDTDQQISRTYEKFDTFQVK